MLRACCRNHCLEGCSHFCVTIYSGFSRQAHQGSKACVSPELPLYAASHRNFPVFCQWGGLPVWDDRDFPAAGLFFHWCVSISTSAVWPGWVIQPDLCKPKEQKPRSWRLKWDKLPCTNKNGRQAETENYFKDLKYFKDLIIFLTQKALLAALGINIFATTNQALYLYGHQIIWCQSETQSLICCHLHKYA